MGPKMLCHAPRIGKLIRGLIEPQGKGIDLRYAQLVHFLHDGGRIQAAGQIHPKGHIAHQLPLDGLTQVHMQLLHGFALVHVLPWAWLKAPIGLQGLDRAIPVHEIMRRR